MRFATSLETSEVRTTLETSEVRNYTRNECILDHLVSETVPTFFFACLLHTLSSIQCSIKPKVEETFMKIFQLASMGSEYSNTTVSFLSPVVLKYDCKFP